MRRTAQGMSAAAVVLGMVFAAAAQVRAQSAIESTLPAYRPVNSLKGEITIAGSDAMTQMAAMWGEQFTKFYPDVKINLLSTSSTSAVEAVRDGKADFALMSREVLPEEIAEFKKVTGHDPQVIPSSMERIAVLVNSKNPIKGITLAELEALFAAQPKRGGADVKTWKDVGATGEIASKPVSVVLRGEATGAPATFQAVVMEGGAFRNDVKLQDSYVNVTKAVAADPAAISFAGTMYILRGVRTVPVAIEKDQPFIGVDSPEADAGQYPLVRPQHMVVNYDSASKPLTDIQQEFMKYVFSQMGQEDVIKAGFAPVAAAPAKIALERVGLHTFN